MVIKTQGEIQKVKVQRKSAACIHIMTENLWDSSSSALKGNVKSGQLICYKIGQKCFLITDPNNP